MPIEPQKMNNHQTSDKVELDKLTERFFSLFTNTNKQELFLEDIFSICLASTVIIKKDKTAEHIYNLTEFIAPRKTILTNGTLTDFAEKETFAETKIAGNIAQRFSKYTKKGLLNNENYAGNGCKMFQFVKTANGWKINAVIWEDE